MIKFFQQHASQSNVPLLGGVLKGRDASSPFSSCSRNVDTAVSHPELAKEGNVLVGPFVRVHSVLALVGVRRFWPIAGAQLVYFCISQLGLPKQTTAGSDNRNTLPHRAGDQTSEIQASAPLVPGEGALFPTCPYGFFSFGSVVTSSQGCLGFPTSQPRSHCLIYSFFVKLRTIVISHICK